MHASNYLRRLSFYKTFSIESSVFLKLIVTPNLNFLKLILIDNLQENFLEELSHKILKLASIHIEKD